MTISVLGVCGKRGKFEGQLPLPSVREGEVGPFMDIAANLSVMLLPFPFPLLEPNLDMGGGCGKPDEPVPDRDMTGG